ncbi:RNA polymerase ECF-type sigma factor [Gemmatimonas aurantiaca T-27]|uniref:RNA polymerase ECF-type sigma factor n=1 Tax=Gemmatimonas aurantiaca (strain DSM 14586 / JCM 11422 / NBRC 100505 / T-27) TaxID=379066 RepID=C1AEL3_GEMAT|nr:RNA polymerase ECF-type sigma factor [Gemmatimonas aurantiaca T-27]
MHSLDAGTLHLVLQQARHGDRASFARLVEHYYPRALRFALQMLHHREDAEEAVQDAFLRVHDNLARFREDAPFDPWFFRILGNRCRTLMAKRKRHHETFEYGDVPVDAASDAETDIPDEGFVRDVHQALAQLPPEQREAFLLRHVNDMDYEEMTIVTGAKGSTLRMRVKRAIDTLRVVLREGAIHE